MLEWIKQINQNYAGALSLLSSLIMVVVTIMYVKHTKQQANYSKESVELVTKQLKTNKQPCIVPLVEDSFGSAFDAGEYTRIQLGFDINLKNVGDAPAISIYSLANIELQYSFDDVGNKKLLNAALLPHLIQALSAEEEQRIELHFETEEVQMLVKELAIAMEKNWERIKTDPSQHHHIGAMLNVQILFKNAMEQWCESMISYEIAWLTLNNSQDRKTRNMNENSIPPKHIHRGDEFKAVLCSSHLAPFSYKMVTEEYVKSILDQCIDESPWLLEADLMQHQYSVDKNKWNMIENTRY